MNRLWGDLLTQCVSGILFVLIANSAGCAIYLGPGIVDVTNDPRFQDGYHAGHTYLVTREMYLVRSNAPNLSPESHLVVTALWEPKRFDRLGPDEVSDYSPHILAKIPAGSTIQIHRLLYEYDRWLYQISLQSLDFREILAVGTLHTTAGRWEDVTCPSGGPFKFGKVGYDNHFSVYPDADALEEIQTTSAPTTQ